MSEYSLIYHGPVTRAAPLPAEERRRALIDATLPLLREHGPALSTRQIAEAAGVAEGTIFRVFDSKDDLISTCLAESLSIEHLTEAVDAAATDDLATTLTGLCGVLLHHLDDVRALTSMFGHPPIHDRAHHKSPTTSPDSGDDVHRKASGSACPRPDFRALHDEVTAHVAAVLEPHRARLRVDPALAGSYLISLSFGAHHPLVGTPALADPATLARLALSGLIQEA